MKKMKTIISEKISDQVNSIAVKTAKISMFTCRGLFYQPEEPEGLREFVERNNKEG